MVGSYCQWIGIDYLDIVNVSKTNGAWIELSMCFELGLKEYHLINVDNLLRV